MRYNSYQIQNYILDLEKKIIDALNDEHIFREQFLESLYWANGEFTDGWDLWEQDKHTSYLKDDEKSYQRKIRFRMKLEKQKRILERRLCKINNK